MSWLNDIKRAGGRVLFGWGRGVWTVTGYSDSAPKSVIMRTFRSYADAHEFFDELRRKRRADVLNLWAEDGELLRNWSIWEEPS